MIQRRRRDDGRRTAGLRGEGRDGRRGAGGSPFLVHDSATGEGEGGIVKERKEIEGEKKVYHGEMWNTNYHLLIHISFELSLNFTHQNLFFSFNLILYIVSTLNSHVCITQLWYIS